jgi:hypothetical protein
MVPVTAQKLSNTTPLLSVAFYQIRYPAPYPAAHQEDLWEGGSPNCRRPFPDFAMQAERTSRHSIAHTHRLDNWWALGMRLWGRRGYCHM